MAQVAVFISDFHLGDQETIDAFDADDQFGEVLAALSRHHLHDEVDLVLLGDMVDLVGIAEPTCDLHLPASAMDTRALQRALVYELLKLERILKRHGNLFQDLGHFLAADVRRRRIVYVPGNHDHSLVALALQSRVRKAILTPRVVNSANVSLTQLNSHITFPVYYFNDVLGVYGEHGNQLTTLFRYRDFPRFGEECSGHIRYRLVWNALQQEEPAFAPLFRCAFPRPIWIPMLLYCIRNGLVRHLPRVWCLLRAFSADNRSQVQWARKQLQPVLPWLLHLLRCQLFGRMGDELGEYIQEWFERDSSRIPLCGHQLDPAVINTVILGHTHSAHAADLREVGRLKYFNTGSWIIRYGCKGREINKTWVILRREPGSRYAERALIQQ